MVRRPTRSFVHLALGLPIVVAVVGLIHFNYDFQPHVEATSSKVVQPGHSVPALDQLPIEYSAERRRAHLETGGPIERPYKVQPTAGLTQSPSFAAHSPTAPTETRSPTGHPTEGPPNVLQLEVQRRCSNCTLLRRAFRNLVTPGECVQVARNLSDGFGSQMQYTYAVVIEAVERGLPACVEVSEIMEHVSNEEKDMLYSMVGLPYRNRTECAQCKHTFNFWGNWHNLGNQLIKEFQAMYTPPFQATEWRRDKFIPGSKHVVIHVRVRNAVDNRNQTTYNPLLIKIIEHIMARLAGEDVVLHIYSQDVPHSKPYMEILNRFSNGTTVNLWLNATTAETFDAFVRADVLVTAPSALSFIAGVLNPNLVYYTSYPLGPYPHFIHIT